VWGAVIFDHEIGCVWLAVPQATEWQHIRNQINAAMVFARADFYSRAMQKNVAKQFGPV